MKDYPVKDRYDFQDLVAITKLLREPGGCPWDGEQTHSSIRRNFLEEAYEFCEGLDRDDPVLMCEELGDVLLQVVFHADIERCAGRFTLDDVCDGICRKLILRHPHVFGTTNAADTQTVLKNWEEIKRVEKNQRTHTETLQAVATTLPALWRADKLQSKAEKAGFRWSSEADALQKLREEVGELEQALDGSGDPAEELGDVLFAAVCAGRFRGIDPETALTAANEKFIRRFARMEACASAAGKELTSLSEEELLRLWYNAKQEDS